MLVTQVGPCENLSYISNETMSRIASISGQTWDPIDYAYPPDAECVGYWINDEPSRLMLNHAIMDRETFVSRFRRND